VWEGLNWLRAQPSGIRVYGNEQRSCIKRGGFFGLMTECQLFRKDCGPYSQLYCVQLGCCERSDCRITAIIA
jgi:hypothetical protein